MTDLATDYVFPGLTPASPLADLCHAALTAGGRAARSDIEAEPSVLATDAATVDYLFSAETREALESWLGSYRHDEEVLSGLSDEDAAEVLASAWLHYQTIVMQARDAAREAAREA